MASLSTIEHDDYKAIRRVVGISPAEWHRLQREDEYRRYYRWRYHEEQVRVLSCRCRSVWCKNCTTLSPTNAAITGILRGFDWRGVRHIILTVSRDLDPINAFDKIRENRAIARLVRGFDTSYQYLWVLEWHADGYPHWHVLVDTGMGGRGAMIGKKRIDAGWGRGLVWESYVRDAGHWEAICGYHSSRGYLAGERKKHQIELPDGLKDRSRIRKFGTNVPRGTSRQGKTNKGKRRRVATSYRDRECDERSTVLVRGGAVSIGLPGRETRQALLASGLDRIDHSTYRGSVEEVWRALIKLPADSRGRGNPKSPDP